jgi:carboxyl-terminal processing protease
LLQGDIAYLRVYSFFTLPGGDGTREYLQELDKQIDMLRAAKPAGWLLDMRNNRGGSEGLAAYLATRLGLEGPLVENRERGGKTTLIPSVGRNITDGKPVAIVIDGGSASAAEIVAASLQDSHVAKVYGLKSPGLVNTARFFPVAGGGLEITVARAYSGPLKRVIDKVGVTPDETVALDTSATGPWSDAQLDRAIAYIRSQALVVSAAR